jgi:hypothetical protein
MHNVSIVAVIIILFLSVLILVDYTLIYSEAFGSSILGSQSNNDSKTLEMLKKYALDLINADRKKNDLSPVNLSNNGAAQVHANEILKKEYISHWTNNGFKPYMLYSFYNGTGYVQQNVGQISYSNIKDGQNNTKSSDFCTSSYQIQCKPLNPLESIKKLEHSMMYNDTTCCNDGHRQNILDRFHTHVSLGIAYNKYYFVLVQNFENHYLDRNYTINKNSKEIEIEARILNFTDKQIKINHLAVFLDKFPTEIEYEHNKNKPYYEMGDLQLIVAEPLPSYKKYLQENSFKIVEAKKWTLEKDRIDLEFKIPDNVNLKNKVVTMVVYAENSNSVHDTKDPTKIKYIPMTSYTIFDY